MSEHRKVTVVLAVLGALLGVGLLFGWPAALAVVVVGLVLWLGCQLADEQLARDRTRLDAQRQALDMEWRALEQTGRVRSLFFETRRAMHEEAQHHRAPEPPNGGQ